jgi:DNA-binding transcriptional MerR regulator
MDKTKKHHAKEATAGGFRIGTVSHLTGIDPHTIRAWERRYGAIEPGRSEGGSRRYDEGHVARLQLIKAAVDAGDAISTVAELSDAQLRARLADLAGLARREAAGELEDLELGQRALRLGVLGSTIAERLRLAPARLAQLDVVVSENELADFSAAAGGQAIDVLLVSLDTLGDQPTEAFRALMDGCSPRVGIVSYYFARRSVISGLLEAGAKLLRGPLDVSALRRAVFDWLVIREAPKARAELGAPIELPEAGPAPERLFTDRQIARLSEIASSVECECPNHLSRLISSLAEFERYSHDCVNRSPSDARLHRRLALGTARARYLVEQLLTEVCEHDGIRL